MSKSYEVYVGNLSAAISQKNLKDLFSKVGTIVSIWINRRNKKFTYGFVGFCYLDDARNACKTLNNRNLDGLIIKVNLSTKTEEKLAKSVKKRDSILLELPKRTRKKIPTKTDQLKEILRADIVKTNDKKFVSDFVCALKEMDNISCKPLIIKTEAEKTNLQTLENLILRYYQPVKKNNIQIDIDLSNNVLNQTLNAKFFEIEF